MDIIMIRHGESEDNIKKVFSNYNTQLTEYGKKQITRTKESLKKYEFGNVYYSPLTRTNETRQYLGLEGVKEPRIAEIDFGIFTGLAYEELTRLYPLESKQWIEDPYNYSILKGESINTVYKRVEEFLVELILKDKNTLLITHEGIIRIICSWVFDNPAYFFKFKADNGSLSIISVDDGYKFIKKLNYH